MANGLGLPDRATCAEINPERFCFERFFAEPLPGGGSPFCIIPCLTACHSFALRPLDRQYSAKLPPRSRACRKCSTHVRPRSVSPSLVTSDISLSCSAAQRRRRKLPASAKLNLIRRTADGENKSQCRAQLNSTARLQFRLMSVDLFEPVNHCAGFLVHVPTVSTPASGVGHGVAQRAEGYRDTPTFPIRSLWATMTTIEVRQYQTAEGRTPLAEWLEGLRDRTTRSRIVARLDRLTEGLRGDWKNVSDGVCELRIDHGPGYRVYYGQEGDTLILLLCGGTKRTQARDIENAHAYWKDYKARTRQRAVSRGASSG